MENMVLSYAFPKSKYEQIKANHKMQVIKNYQLSTTEIFLYKKDITYHIYLRKGQVGLMCIAKNTKMCKQFPTKVEGLSALCP